MAERREGVDGVAAVSASFGESAARNAASDRARRLEALSLRLAGLSWEQVGERMNISASGALQLVQRTLDSAEREGVDAMRAIENQRLDRAQTGIWTEVLQGNAKAIALYLRISDHRAKLNGLYAPTKIDVAMNVRHELARALDQLDELVLPILEGEVVEDAVLEIEPGKEEEFDESDVDALFGRSDQP